MMITHFSKSSLNFRYIAKNVSDTNRQFTSTQTKINPLTQSLTVSCLRRSSAAFVASRPRELWLLINNTTGK